MNIFDLKVTSFAIALQQFPSKQLAFIFETVIDTLRCYRDIL